MIPSEDKTMNRCMEQACDFFPDWTWAQRQEWARRKTELIVSGKYLPLGHTPWRRAPELVA